MRIILAKQYFLKKTMSTQNNNDEQGQDIFSIAENNTILSSKDTIASVLKLIPSLIQSQQEIQANQMKIFQQQISLKKEFLEMKNSMQTMPMHASSKSVDEIFFMQFILMNFSHLTRFFFIHNEHLIFTRRNSSAQIEISNEMINVVQLNNIANDAVEKLTSRYVFEDDDNEREDLTVFGPLQEDWQDDASHLSLSFTSKVGEFKRFKQRFSNSTVPLTQENLFIIVCVDSIITLSKMAKGYSSISEPFNSKKTTIECLSHIGFTTMGTDICETLNYFQFFGVPTKKKSITNIYWKISIGDFKRYIQTMSQRTSFYHMNMDRMHNFEENNRSKIETNIKKFFHTTMGAKLTSNLKFLIPGSLESICNPFAIDLYFSRDWIPNNICDLAHTCASMYLLDDVSFATNQLRTIHFSFSNDQMNSNITNLTHDWCQIIRTFNNFNIQTFEELSNYLTSATFISKWRIHSNENENDDDDDDDDDEIKHSEVNVLFQENSLQIDKFVISNIRNRMTAGIPMLNILLNQINQKIINVNMSYNYATYNTTNKSTLTFISQENIIYVFEWLQNKTAVFRFRFDLNEYPDFNNLVFYEKKTEFIIGDQTINLVNNLTQYDIQNVEDILMSETKNESFVGSIQKMAVYKTLEDKTLVFIYFKDIAAQNFVTLFKNCATDSIEDNIFVFQIERDEFEESIHILKSMDIEECSDLTFVSINKKQRTH